MQKRIQIRLDQYDLMVAYILDHYDPDDIDRFRRIIRGISEKQEAMNRHNVYSIYKTVNDQETKEIARQMYLDKAGIPTEFRW